MTFWQKQNSGFFPGGKVETRENLIGVQHETSQAERENVNLFSGFSRKREKVK